MVRRSEQYGVIRAKEGVFRTRRCQEWLKGMSTQNTIPMLNNWDHLYNIRLPWLLSGKESACQCKRHRFNPWVGKIPQRRKWQCSSILARRIPWIEEPGRLQSMGSQRVRRNSVTEQVMQLRSLSPERGSLAESLVEYTVGAGELRIRLWLFRKDNI